MDYNQSPFARMGSAARSAEVDKGLRAYMLGIYNYMASALALTGIVAMLTAKMAVGVDPATGQMMLTELGQALYVGPMKWVVMFAPLAAVLALSFGIQRMSAPMAQAVFWGYSALMGLSLSSIFMIYTGHSIARVFFITAGTFGAMSLYGYTTKRDLTGFGSFLVMGLWGLIIASLVNLFLHSSALDFALSVMGVGIFVGLTAYDTQRLKSLYYSLGAYGEAAVKVSIMGALTLYLDFVNMFLYLLRFFGDRR